jgi:ferric-dicitrate binding protein FerR (iron transport regulator)
VRGIAGGAAFDVAQGQAAPFAVAADDGGVYRLTTDGALRRRRAAGAEVETLASGFAVDTSTTRARPIALTSRYVVWATATQVCAARSDGAAPLRRPATAETVAQLLAQCEVPDPIESTHVEGQVAVTLL